MAAAITQKDRQRYRIYVAIADALAGVLGVFVAQLLVIGPVYLVEQPSENIPLYLLLVPIWILSLVLHSQYEFHPRWLTLSCLFRGLRAALVGTLVCVAITYFANRGAWLSRQVYLHSTLMAAAGFWLVRIAAMKRFPRDVVTYRYLILGRLRRETEFASALTNGQLPGHVEVVGCLVGQEAAATAQAPCSDLRILGDLGDLDSVVAENGVSHVAVSPDEPRTAALARVAAHAEATGLCVERLETTYEDLTGRAPVLLAGAGWDEGFAGTHQTPYMARYKWWADVAVTLVLLPLALVIIGLSALAIKLTSPGPVFYTQPRVGRAGRRFPFVKLRTMVADAEKETGPVWADEGDTRVTPIGRFLRKMRLDELPQLFLVLAGDMSLVGPRPERPAFVEQFIEEIPFYERRLLVRPGITGWAQVHQGYDRNMEDVIEKLRYDLYYIRHVSFTLDIQIVMRTFWVMLGRKGAR